MVTSKTRQGVVIDCFTDEIRNFKVKFQNSTSLWVRVGSRSWLIVEEEVWATPRCLLSPPWIKFHYCEPPFKIKIICNHYLVYVYSRLINRYERLSNPALSPSGNNWCVFEPMFVLRWQLWQLLNPRMARKY